MSEIVKCTYDYMLQNYRCHVDKQKIFKDLITLEGKHREGKANKDTRWLDFSDCKIENFPKNLHEFTPNITSLRINCCRLEKISREHIKNLKSLTFFRIENCGLKSLKGDLFKGLNDLWHISFKNNELEEIEPDILDGLKKLRLVDFQGNKNIDSCYNSASRDGKKLEDIKREIREKCNKNCVAPQPSSGDSDEKKKIQKLEQQVQRMSIEMSNRKKNDLRLTELLRIFADDAFKDFTINIEDSSFMIHKTLFAARSSTLAELFRNNPEVQELNLRDIPEQTFKAIHDFIYTNELPGEVNYLEIFAAASLLKIKELIKVSADQLIENLSEENSLEMLILSNKFEHKDMRHKAFEIIRTKIFPERKLDDELAKHPDKLKTLINMKKMLEKEFENL